MKKHCFELVLALVLVGSFLPSAAPQAKDEPDNVYYTLTNIWYEKPERIYSTNYHKGAIIQAGTKVSVTSQKKGKILFRETASDVTYTLTHVRKHSTITFDELFKRYFSKESPKAEGAAYNKFTEEEKKNIKSGDVFVGMSREAVLMAYGYPPSHVTPSLSASSWTYWVNRFVRRIVYFENDKVIRIEG